MSGEYYDDWEQSYEKAVVEKAADGEAAPIEEEPIAGEGDDEPIEEEELMVIRNQEEEHKQAAHHNETNCNRQSDNFQEDFEEQEDLDMLYERNVRTPPPEDHFDNHSNHHNHSELEDHGGKTDTETMRNYLQHRDILPTPPPAEDETTIQESIQDPPYRSYIDMPIDLGTIADDDVLQIAKQNARSSSVKGISEEDVGDDEDAIDEDVYSLPQNIRNELTRLSSLLGVTSNLSSESDMAKFLEEARMKVEKLKYASTSFTDKSEGSQDLNSNYSPGGTRQKPSKLRNKLRAATHERELSESDSQGQIITKKENQVSKKAKKLEDSIKDSLKKIKPPTSDWETRYRRMVNKYRKEKEERLAYEDFIKVQNKKIRVLVDHVERLMKAIKYENGKRMQLFDDFSKFKKDHAKLEMKFDKQNRHIAAQNRALSEVTQGSKILEDQLKLMDEKYLELRSKLDFARNYFSSTIRKLKGESQELRIKYATATGGLLLDHAKPPRSVENTGTSYSFRPMSSSSPRSSHNQLQHEGLTFLTTGGDGIPFDATVGSTRPPSPGGRKASMISEKLDVTSSSRPKSASTSRKSMMISTQDNRPQSAFPSSASPHQQFQNQTYNDYQPVRSSSAKVRPKSAAPTMESPLNRLTMKEKEKALTYLCKKIQDKDNTSKVKEKWTADKLAELLAGSS